MSLTIRGDRVIVKAAPPPTEHNGLFLPDSYAPDVMGTVIACGDVQDVKPDDVVIFPPSAGKVLEYEQARYLVLHEDELIAVVE